MERAGVDIIRHGEVRLRNGRLRLLYAIIEGVDPWPARRKAQLQVYDQQTRHEAMRRIETPPERLGIIGKFEYLKAPTRRTNATWPGQFNAKSIIRAVRTLHARGPGGEYDHGNFKGRSPWTLAYALSQNSSMRA